MIQRRADTEVRPFYNMKMTVKPSPWPHATPADAGFNPEGFDEGLRYAMERRTTALVILRHGSLVHEEYAEGWNPMTSGPIYSAGKSIVGTLVGLAQQEGLLSLDDSCARWFPQWRGDPREAILVRHLVSMTSGLLCTFHSDFVACMQEEDETAYGLTLRQVHPPGTHWDYNNTAYRLLHSLLERASGMDLDSFSHRALFDRLGMPCASWELRRTGTASNPQHILCSARDLARFGQMILDGGRHAADSIMDPAFLADSFSRGSGNGAYGLLWWLNGGSSYRLPYKNSPFEGPLFPSAPPDTRAGLGYRDNKLYVIPSLGIVVARLGGMAVKVEKGQKIPDLTLSDFDDNFLGFLCA